MKYLLLMLMALSHTQCDHPSSRSDKPFKLPDTLITPLALDRGYLSGLDLDPVRSSWDPDRKLFQKKLYRGTDLGVYVVSSETATATWEDYSIDEFIYVINGRARLRPQGLSDQYFTPGSFFVAPYGYKGDWETQGGTEYYHELSVVAVQPDTSRKPLQITPHRLDSDKIAGIGLTQEPNPDTELRDVLYDGAQLHIVLYALQGSSHPQSIEISEDELIYVIAGSIEYKTGQSSTIFYAGDFFILPKGYNGRWQCRGHHLYRYISVTKAR